MDAGRQQGWQEGLAVGERLGEARTLLRLMKVRFGPPSADRIAGVEAATPEQLDPWLVRVLTAASSEEVVGGP